MNYDPCAGVLAGAPDGPAPFPVEGAAQGMVDTAYDWYGAYSPQWRKDAGVPLLIAIYGDMFSEVSEGCGMIAMLN